MPAPRDYPAQPIMPDDNRESHLRRSRSVQRLLADSPGRTKRLVMAQTTNTAASIGTDVKPGVASGMRLSTALGSAILVAMIYFAAARLSLSLLAQPEGVAVFWPASGVAGGALLFLGRKGVFPVVLGVFVATVAANLLGDRNLPLAVAFGCCNAGEALVFALLVRNQPRSRSREAFADLATARWFFQSALFSAALMAMLATAAIHYFGTALVPVTSIWWAWFASDAVGIIMFAPVLMLLGNTWGVRLSAAEAAEGGLLLVALVAATAFTFFRPPDAVQAQMPLPIIVLFPLLLWCATRCRPLFLAAGISIAALMIVWATTHGLGHFGGTRTPLAERVFAAQIMLIGTAFCGLVLVAAFNERRGVEERIQKIATSAPGMIYSFRVDQNGNYSMPYASNVINDLLGHAPGDVREDASTLFRKIAPEDVGRVEAEIDLSRQTLSRFHSEFRYIHPQLGEIWLEANSNPVQETDASTIWHGFLQDITVRRQAEARVGWLTGETFHRSYNLMTVVQGVAFHTAREEQPAQFLEVFCKRIDGLAASHDLLVANGVDGVTVLELAQSQLAHFANLIGSRILLDGPAVKLNPSAAQAIGMMLHELATNAYKHGSLSGDSGTVRIDWSCNEVFYLRWSEAGGPPAQMPDRQGFGHRVLVKMAPHELGARIGMDYTGSGLVWRLDAPSSRVRETSAEHDTKRPALLSAT